MPQFQLLKFLIDPSTGEGFNLVEDGSKKKYQLQRFLKLFGTELDNIKGLANNFKNLIDVDNIDSDLLPYLGELLGLIVNRDLPIAGRRREIKNIVHVYKNKGTIGGIQRLLEGITGLEAVVDEYVDNILLSNRRYSTTVDFAPSVIAKVGLENDTTDYTIDFRDEGVYRWDKLALFIILDGQKKITEAIVKKLSRIVPNFIPLNAEAKITFIDAIYTEDFDIVGTASDITEKINEKIDEETYLLSSIVEAKIDELDSIPSLTEDPTNSTYIMFTNSLTSITNSKKSLTPSLWDESWSDSIFNL